MPTMACDSVKPQFSMTNKKKHYLLIVSFGLVFLFEAAQLSKTLISVTVEYRLQHKPEQLLKCTVLVYLHADINTTMSSVTQLSPRD